MTRRKGARADAPGRYPLRITPTAQAVRQALRGDSEERFEQLRAALKAQACKAGGYRLLARDGGWSRFCCVHLDRQWRVIVTFDEEGSQILHIGEHDGPEFYRALSADYDIAAIGQARDEKPDCCGEDGWPSVGASRRERAAGASASHARDR